MTWQTLRIVAAALFALFALILIVVPGAQILRGRLPLRQLWGFLLAGAGFGLLAAGIVVVPAANGQALIITGVIMTVIGNLAQQRVMREHTDRHRR